MLCACLPVNLSGTASTINFCWTQASHLVTTSSSCYPEASRAYCAGTGMNLREEHKLAEVTQLSVVEPGVQTQVPQTSQGENEVPGPSGTPSPGYQPVLMGLGHTPPHPACVSLVWLSGFPKQPAGGAVDPDRTAVVEDGSREEDLLPCPAGGSCSDLLLLPLSPVARAQQRRHRGSRNLASLHLRLDLRGWILGPTVP
jgi:hypothetical protein